MEPAAPKLFVIYDLVSFNIAVIKLYRTEIRMSEVKVFWFFYFLSNNFIRTSCDSCIFTSNQTKVARTDYTFLNNILFSIVFFFYMDIDYHVWSVWSSYFPPFLTSNDIKMKRFTKLSSDTPQSNRSVWRNKTRNDQTRMLMQDSLMRYVCSPHRESDLGVWQKIKRRWEFNWFSLPFDVFNATARIWKKKEKKTA